MCDSRTATAKGTDFQIVFQDLTFEPFDKIIWDVVHLRLYDLLGDSTSYRRNGSTFVLSTTFVIGEVAESKSKLIK